jgi:hypothetical protein
MRLSGPRRVPLYLPLAGGGRCERERERGQCLGTVMIKIAAVLRHDNRGHRKLHNSGSCAIEDVFTPVAME